MNRGAFDFLVKPIDFKDLEVTIDKTVKHAREVRRTLRSSEENNLLRMFVNAGILERLLPLVSPAHPSGEGSGLPSPNETIEATVAFIDVQGFTSITRSETADLALRTLNANFDVIVPEITSRGGVVDKFVGDAVMALFRDEGHLERALDACLSARRALADMAERAGAPSPYAHGISVGLDSGAMICGSIGSRVVSRLDYTVLGDVVNQAARLQQSPIAGGRILVTEAVHARIKGLFECESAGTLILPGRAGATPVFEVLHRVVAEAPIAAAETILMDGESSAVSLSDGAPTPSGSGGSSGSTPPGQGSGPTLASSSAGA
jgi:class 3 adenylate cyclase